MTISFKLSVVPILAPRASGRKKIIAKPENIEENPELKK